MQPSKERKAGSLCVKLVEPNGPPAPGALAKKAGPRWCVLSRMASPNSRAPNPNVHPLFARCVLEEGEFFVLPAASSTAAEVQIRLGMVGVRGVKSCTSDLQARRTRWSVVTPTPVYSNSHAPPVCPLPTPHHVPSSLSSFLTLQAGAPHAIIVELSTEPRYREGWQGVGESVQLVLVAENATEQAEWQACLQTVATAYRNWRRVNDAPGAMLGGLKSVGKIAAKAAGGGFGWQVGRDAGRAFSRSIGL